MNEAVFASTVFDTEDARVRDRDAMGVGTEVAEHIFRQSKHEPLSAPTVHATAGIARCLPSVAVPRESVVEPEGIDTELEMGRSALESREPIV